MLLRPVLRSGINAVTYTDERGQIRMSAAVEGNRCVITRVELDTAPAPA